MLKGEGGVGVEFFLLLMKNQTALNGKQILRELMKAFSSRNWLVRRKTHKEGGTSRGDSLITSLVSHRGEVCLVLGFLSLNFLFYFEILTLLSFQVTCPSSCVTGLIVFPDS